MKTIFRTFFLIASSMLLSVVLSSSMFFCPEPEEDGDVIQFANMGDCSTFWKCEEMFGSYWPVLLKCPAGLWFNHLENVCDYPENVSEGKSCVAPAPDEGQYAYFEEIQITYSTFWESRKSGSALMERATTTTTCHGSGHKTCKSGTVEGRPYMIDFHPYSK